MSGGPLAQESLLDGLRAHMAASLGINTNDPDEVAGLDVMAKSALDYFASSVRGAPPGAGQTLLWTIFSALWEGQVGQDEINDFFTHVNVDPGRTVHAWRSLTAEERAQPHSVVLVPGSLSVADIAGVTAALFRSRGEVDNTPS
jgi:hypothetical protein